MKLKFILLSAVIVFAGTLYAQKFEILDGDTVNYIDEFNKKQGRWLINDPTDSYVLEEGIFIDSKRQGVWKKYFPDGKIKQEFTYVNNRPDGYAKVYFANGKLSEEGLWQGDKWVGQYKFYYENGQVAHEWNYSDKGKRSGVQRYYYENGAVMIEGDWKDGNKDGTITEYYADGSKKSEQTFVEGTLDAASSVEYQPKVVATNINQTPIKQTDTAVVAAIQRTKVDIFDGNGFHKLYDQSGRLEYEGVFYRGRIMDGKRYVYSADGTVEKAAIYEDGRIVGYKTAAELGTGNK